MKKSRRSLSWLMMLIVLCFSMNLFTLDTFATSILYGDVNGDEVVYYDDYQLLSDYLSDPNQYPLSPAELANADVDRDGNVGQDDVYYIMQYCLGTIRGLPVSNRLLFTSDIHEEFSNLATWLSNAAKPTPSATPLPVDHVIYGGDYMYGINYSGSYTNETTAFNAAYNIYPNAIISLAKGNHDYSGTYNYAQGMQVDPVYNNYGLYVMSPFYPDLSQNPSANPSFISDDIDDFDRTDIDDLKTALERATPWQPFFVVSHIPLHVFSYREYDNALMLIQLLNQYPNAIYLWGHNHSQTNPTSDPGYSVVKTAGDEIQYEFNTQPIDINFTYASMGAMSNGATINSRGLCVELNQDAFSSTVTLKYKDLDGNTLTTPAQTTISLP